MGKAEKMANTPSKTASTLKSRDALMLEFKEKFGHTYDPGGYHGHPLFGYHCYGCGIHVSKITNKGLREQLKLDVGEENNGNRFSKRMANAMGNSRVIGGSYG